MGTQAFTATPARGAAWPTTLGTVAVSVALGVGIGWTAHTASLAPKAAVAAAAQPAIVAAASAATPATRTTGSSQRLVLLLPGDGAFVSSSRIAIAGLAHSRPHGVPIRTVSVGLFVGGRRGDRLVARSELQVSSSRFAGFLDIPSSVTATHAVLRISDPTRQAVPDVVQQLDLDLR